MSQSSLRAAFSLQAEACESLGSPFTARLCQLMADNLPDLGPVWEKIISWEGDVSPYGDSIPLRIAGALHGVVLEGKDKNLTAVYPPFHNKASDEQLWSAIRQVIDNQSDYFLERLKRAPQTNEVRRAGILLPGFLEIARLTGNNKFVMSELGASAGLNLYWDKYFYQLGDRQWGSKAAKTRLQPAVTGLFPHTDELEIVSRAACDLNPIDLSKPDQQQRLLSYIWPDQEDRMIRTASAINIAAENSVHVEQSDAVDWLKARLETIHDDLVHVIYHTIAWQYFPDDKKSEGEAILKQAGSRATDRAPIAWLRLEADGDTPGAGLVLTLWPSGETKILARGDFHGRWIEWLG